MDVPLVILDEATANLDPESEALVQASIGQLLEGRSALIIAHRLSTVRSADRIVVLDSGRVAETGTHDALMASGGVYRRLVEATRLHDTDDTEDTEAQEGGARLHDTDSTEDTEAQGGGARLHDTDGAEDREEQSSRAAEEQGT